MPSLDSSCYGSENLAVGAAGRNTTPRLIPPHRAQSVAKACRATAISRKAVCQVAPALSHSVRLQPAPFGSPSCTSQHARSRHLHRYSYRACIGLPYRIHASLFPLRSIMRYIGKHESRSTWRSRSSGPRWSKRSHGRADTVPVRLVLWCLWPHCPERWPLVMFWEGAQQDNQIGRSQSVTASFNGIVRQLRRSGAIVDEIR
jgi:hypothetical protein